MHRSLGLAYQDGQDDTDGQAMCSDCFDRLAEQNQILQEFVALAGTDDTCYDLKEERDLEIASRLTGVQLDQDSLLEEFSLPIVCYQCGETVGLVSCMSTEE